MKRNHELRIRFSKEELEKLKRFSDKVGLSVSSFVRLLALRSNLKIEEIN